MTRLTISTDIPEDLERLKRIIAEQYRIVKVKGPTVTEAGRLNYYVVTFFYYMSGRIEKVYFSGTLEPDTNNINH